MAGDGDDNNNNDDDNTNNNNNNNNTIDWDDETKLPVNSLGDENENEDNSDSSKNKENDNDNDSDGDEMVTTTVTDVEGKATDGSGRESEDDGNASVNGDGNHNKNKESSSDSDSGSDDGSSSDSGSDSGSDSDSDDDSNSDDDSDREKPKDGISEYERLRLERIKRNQERLAALGLQNPAFKPKPPKPKRRKSTEPKAPVEPTRKQSSRSSKKRIDYAELPKLHTISERVPKLPKSSSSSKLEPKQSSIVPNSELTPEKLESRLKRRKEKRHNDRVPRFIYDEFNRIKAMRRIGLKKAKQCRFKSEREMRHWAKVARKLTAQEEKQAAAHKKEAEKLLKENEARERDNADREELDCNDMTKMELLGEIDRRAPELWSVLLGHDEKQEAIVRKIREEERERQLIKKQQALERKLTVIDALDRYPKAMNEALNKLNGLLYARAPKDFLPTMKKLSKAQMKRQEEQIKRPLTKKQKVLPAFGPFTANMGLDGVTGSEKEKAAFAIAPITTGVENPGQGTYYTTATSLLTASTAIPRSPIVKKKRGRSLPMHTNTGLANKDLPIMNTIISSPIVQKMKRGRPSLTLPTHSQVEVPTKSQLADVSSLVDLAPRVASIADNCNNNKTNTNMNRKIDSLVHIHNSNKRNTGNDYNESNNNMSNANSMLGTPAPSGSSTATKPSVESSATKPSASSTSRSTSKPSANSTSTKRQRKARDARFVGGWMTPRFSKHLNRTWLERTKPIDNRPVVLVPDDVSKLAGISAKKTAVYDLWSYAPQAGDIILYYPSAHRDVLNVYPDTLGSRQRNLLRVPLWSRASRDRNKMIKGTEKGTIWWTEEWIQSLSVPRKKSERMAAALKEEISHGVGDCDSAANINYAELGDYPLICRVEKTHAEFPDDPFVKERIDPFKKNQDGSYVANMCGVVKESESKPKKKHFKTSPQIRLVTVLKALSPVIAPSEKNGSASVGGIGLAPNFSVVTFPVEAPLEPFIIPFCWAYASFHTLIARETIWIQQASSIGRDGSRSMPGDGHRGKGKIVGFFVGAKTEAPKSNSSLGMQDDGTGEGVLPLTSSVMNTEPGGMATLEPNWILNVDEVSEKVHQTNSSDSVLLMDNIVEVKMILASLTRDEGRLQESIAADLESETDFTATIPIREAAIIVDFLRRYLEQFEPKTSAATSIALPSQQISSTEIEASHTSLFRLILKTLPLRRGVLVTYDSNRRQLHRASPWNIVNLHPTDLTRSLSHGLLGYLDDSLREKTILCINDLIENNFHAELFVPMVTEYIAPAYYSAVPVGMSLDRILARLKPYGNSGSCYYTSMESILMDITLISENCLLYNNPDSELVAYCRDIVPKCQTLIKNIIQNRTSKGSQKIVESNLVGKRKALTIPSFLNTPFKGKLCWEWLQQITPPCRDIEGEKVTRHAPTWIPQCGESIFYSRFNHSKFVSENYNFLDDAQSCIPDFEGTEIMKRNLNREGNVTENMQDDKFLPDSSFHWLEGTVMSVRSSFPKATSNQNEAVVETTTPILIIELRLQYVQNQSNVFVCWRPTFEGSKCKGTGLVHDSFLKPTWMYTYDMQVFPSNFLESSNSLAISKDMLSSIAKCFDFLKHRCIDEISPDLINADLALENAEHCTASNFDSHHLPSFSDFFNHDETKYSSTRVIKRRGYKTALKTLSEVGFMPLWSSENQQHRWHESSPSHEVWMSFPSLCLELIRLRIANGYYEKLDAVVNDVSESYVCTVLFLLSGPWSRNSDTISIRKIVKFLTSSKGHGKMAKIAVKKKSKKKIDEAQMEKSRNNSKTSKESSFEKLSEEEESLVKRIFRIRMYHAAAIVFTLETSHVEKIFNLASTSISNHIPDVIPDIDALETANYTPDQLQVLEKIRPLLHAIGRDPCRNRFKFSYRNIYKVKIKCGGQVIAENGRLETFDDDSMLFEPSVVTASLPDGSCVKLRVRCGNEEICGEKKVVTDGPVTEVESTENDHYSSSSHDNDLNKCYDPDLVGRSHFNFNATDLLKNEDLIRTYFGTPGKMDRCIRCVANGSSLYTCRILRQHSNPDYDLAKNFKGTSGVDALLAPWKKKYAENASDVVTNESNEQRTTKTAEYSRQVIINVEEERKRVDTATKEAEEKKLADALAKEASDARDNLDKASKAHKLAGYLKAQALLLADLEIKLSENFISTNFPFDPADNHYVFCIHCGCAGDLLICDGCPNVSHPKCAGLKEVPDGDWFCHKCTAKQKLAAKTIFPSKDNQNKPNQIVENSNDAKMLQRDLFPKDREHASDCGKAELPDITMKTNQEDHREAAKEPSFIDPETSSSSTLPSNQTTVEPNSNEIAVESGLKTDSVQETISDTKPSGNTESKTPELSTIIRPENGSYSSNLLSNQTNVEPNSNETAFVADSIADTSQEVTADTKRNAETESNTPDLLTNTNIEATKDAKRNANTESNTPDLLTNTNIEATKDEEQPNYVISPEMDGTKLNAETESNSPDLLTNTNIKAMKNEEQPKEIIGPEIDDTKLNNETVSKPSDLLTYTNIEAMNIEEQPNQFVGPEIDNTKLNNETAYNPPDLSTNTNIEAMKNKEQPKHVVGPKIDDTKLNDETVSNPPDLSTNTNIKAMQNEGQPNQIIGPEIDDEEFEGKALELDKLLTGLINKRFPPKVEPIEPQAPKSNPLDALGDTYVREFLSFINIHSAEELLSTKSGPIAKDLEIWRKEKGNPMSENSCSSAVSGWKNVVRKAVEEQEKESDPQDDKIPPGEKKKTDHLQALPPQARKFCSYLGIADAEIFLATRTSDLGRKYASWRKKQNKSKLAHDDGPTTYITSWKRELRKSIATSLESLNERDIPKGFKVRKLFEDGNYYEGEVVSGPSAAFDETKGKMVLCWRVKYLDDDEEEFNMEELEQWGVVADKNTDGGVLSPNVQEDKPFGDVDVGQQRQEEIGFPQKVISTDNNPSDGTIPTIRTPNERMSTENNSSPSTQMAGTVRDDGKVSAEIATSPIVEQVDVVRDDGVEQYSPKENELSPKFAPTGIDPSTNESANKISKDTTSKYYISTDNAPTVKLSSIATSAESDSNNHAPSNDASANDVPKGIASKEIVPTGIPSMDSIGKKVQDLNFAPANSTVPVEESNPTLLDIEIEATTSAPSLDIEWHSPPRLVRPIAKEETASKLDVPGSSSEDDSSMPLRMMPRRSSAKPTEKTSSATGESSSSNEAPLDKSGKCHRSSTNQSAEKETNSEVVPLKSEEPGRRRITRGSIIPAEEAMSIKGEKPGRRRSTRESAISTQEEAPGRRSIARGSTNSTKDAVPIKKEESGRRRRSWRSIEIDMRTSPLREDRRRSGRRS